MTALISIRVAGMRALVLFVPVFASAPGTAGEEISSREGRSAKSVPTDVQNEVARRSAEKRGQIIEDAVAALRESRSALTSLDENRKEAALESLAKAVGKLELVVAREPNLTLAPVDVDLAVYDLFASTETVAETIERAGKFLEDGMVQDARDLISDLASELVIGVTSIPLVTYPEAIKAVTPLVEAGKTQEAMRALEVALSTLVVIDTVVPLPELRTEMLIEDVERLARKDSRSESESKRLSAHLEEAREQLALGQALGYGSRDAFANLYRELEEIETKTARGEPGEGLFDDLRDALSRAFS